MSRQQAFEAIYAKQHDVPAESLVQYRHKSKDGYNLPGIASHYRTYCEVMDSEEIQGLRKDAGQLKADNDLARMRIKELDLLFGRYILAMRSALIEEEHGKGPAAAMEWIYNSLAGPGELPPEGETDSQAYFDREIVAVDDGMQEVMAFHEGRRTAADKRAKV